MKIVQAIGLWLAVIVWYIVYGVLVALETIFGNLFTGLHFGVRFIREADARWFLKPHSWSRAWRKDHPKLSRLVRFRQPVEEIAEEIEIPREVTISDIMTARSKIVSVKFDEFLGPLVLDELARTEHSYFPVVRDDLDHVVGILDVSELLALDDKKSNLAHELMGKRVTYLQASSNLRDGLDVLLKAKRHLALVRDDEKRTVGLVTLTDIITKLFEQK